MRTKFDPIGFTYHAAPYCYECGLNLPDIDPEGNEKHAVFPWDEYVWVDLEGNLEKYTCDECGEPIH